MKLKLHEMHIKGAYMKITFWRIVTKIGKIKELIIKVQDLLVYLNAHINHTVVKSKVKRIKKLINEIFDAK